MGNSSVGQSDHNEIVEPTYGSSTTMAESINQNDDTNNSSAGGFKMTDHSSSCETQKNELSIDPLIDMKKARALLESGSDMKQDGPCETAVSKFIDENTE